MIDSTEEWGRESGDVDHDFANDTLTRRIFAWKTERIAWRSRFLMSVNGAGSDIVEGNSTWRNAAPPVFVMTLTESCRKASAIDTPMIREKPVKIINCVIRDSITPHDRFAHESFALFVLLLSAENHRQKNFALSTDARRPRQVLRKKTLLHRTRIKCVVISR